LSIENNSPWFFARDKNDEIWEYGGTKEQAVINCLDFYGKLDYFYIAPSHKSTSEDDSDQEYTIELNKIEKITYKEKIL
jgi:hypothetical protein